MNSNNSLTGSAGTPLKRKTSREGRSFWASWWVVPSLLILILLVGMWDISLRVAQKHDHPEEHFRGVRDVERLIKDTSELLLAAGLDSAGTESTRNMTMSIKHDLKRLQGDEHKQAAVLDELTRENARLEEALSRARASEHGLGAVQDGSVRVHAGNVYDKWLVIGINTVARKGGHDYLIRTLRAIARELPSDPTDLLYGKVLVLVANVQGQFHDVYFKAKEMFSTVAHAKGIHFEFIDRESFHELPNPHPDSKDEGTPNKPGHRVRKQTRDVISVMRESAKPGRRGQYYLFLEDDMLLCPSGFAAIQYMLHKSTLYHPNWLAVKASYGMNGIFLHAKDVLPFSSYLERHQARRPPDHLVVEWYAGETKEARAYKRDTPDNKVRANVGFKYNIFDHVGTSSTLRSQDQSTFPRCYELLVEPTNFKVEAFSPRECPHDDIWPCNVEHPNHALVDWASLRDSGTRHNNAHPRLRGARRGQY